MQQSQAETLATLRQQIASLERRSGPGSPGMGLPFGVPALDACLPGQGLALGAVHELFASGAAVEHGAAPALFAAGVLARCSGPVLWIAARGDLYPPALARAGLDPARLILVTARHGALRAMEESLRHPGLAGVVCEHEGRGSASRPRGGCSWPPRLPACPASCCAGRSASTTRR